MLTRLNTADPLEVGRIQRGEGVNCPPEATEWLRFVV